MSCVETSGSKICQHGRKMLILSVITLTLSMASARAQLTNFNELNIDPKATGPMKELIPKAMMALIPQCPNCTAALSHCIVCGKLGEALELAQSAGPLLDDELKSRLKNLNQWYKTSTSVCVPAVGCPAMTSAFDRIKDQLLQSIGSNLVYAVLLSQAQCTCTKMYQHQSSDIQPSVESNMAVDVSQYIRQFISHGVRDIQPSVESKMAVPVSHYIRHFISGKNSSETHKANISPRPRVKANDTETQKQNEAPRSRSEKTNNSEKVVKSEEKVQSADRPSSSCRDPATSFITVIALTCILFYAHHVI